MNGMLKTMGDYLKTSDTPTATPRNMDNANIEVRGAREHNLQNVSILLPRNQLIVFTGVSGSGKSSMAFDTLYAEGQRRYLESLSSISFWTVSILICGYIGA